MNSSILVPKCSADVQPVVLQSVKPVLEGSLSEKIKSTIRILKNTIANPNISCLKNFLITERKLTNLKVRYESIVHKNASDKQKVLIRTSFMTLTAVAVVLSAAFVAALSGFAFFMLGAAVASLLSPLILLPVALLVGATVQYGANLIIGGKDAKRIMNCYSNIITKILASYLIPSQMVSAHEKKIKIFNTSMWNLEVNREICRGEILNLFQDKRNDGQIAISKLEENIRINPNSESDDQANIDILVQVQSILKSEIETYNQSIEDI